MTNTIEYLRRCADNKVLEASLTPAQCREIVQMHDDLMIDRLQAQLACVTAERDVMAAQSLATVPARRDYKPHDDRSPARRAGHGGGGGAMITAQDLEMAALSAGMTQCRG